MQAVGGITCPVLAEMLVSGRAYAADGARVSVFPSGIALSECHFLYVMTREMGVGTTLETGLGYGISALAILQGHAENGGGRHITVDPFQQSKARGIGVLNVERAGYAAMHEHHEAASHVALPQLRDAGTRLKLAFIDGSHRFEFVFLDFLYVDFMLEIGGIVVVHDAWLPSVRKFLSYLLANRAKDYEPLSPVILRADAVLEEEKKLSLSLEHPREPVLVEQLARWVYPGFMAFKKLRHCEYRDDLGLEGVYCSF